METTIFDNSAAGSGFDGAKTLAQLGLTDAAGVGTISGGRLIIAGGSPGYDSDYITANGGLFPTVTATIDVSTIGSGHALIGLRRQGNGDAYFVWIDNTGYPVVLVYSHNGPRFIPCFVSNNAPNSVTGLVKYTCAMSPGPSGTVNLLTTVAPVAGGQVSTAPFTGGAGTGYTVNMLNDLTGPQVGGTAGPGASASNVQFTALKIESSDTAATNTSGDTLVLCIGDSQTYGTTTSNPPATGFPALLQSDLGRRAAVVNMGHPGESASGVDGSFADIYAGILTQSYTSKITNILIGINDLDGGATPSALEANYTSIVSKARAAGASQIWVNTLMDHPPQRTNIATFNTWLKTNSIGADKITDLAAVPALADATNTMYWNSDQLHPNDAGQQAMENAVLMTFNNVFGPGAMDDSGSYASMPSNEVTVTAGYVPNTPIIISFNGRGTFAAPQVNLMWSAGTWGRIDVERLTLGSLGAAGQYSVVASVLATTDGDPTTVATTYTDFTVVNGVTYKYRIIAYPFASAT